MQLLEIFIFLSCFKEPHFPPLSLLRTFYSVFRLAVTLIVSAFESKTSGVFSEVHESRLVFRNKTSVSREVVPIKWMRVGQLRIYTKKMTSACGWGGSGEGGAGGGGVQRTPTRRTHKENCFKRLWMEVKPNQTMIRIARYGSRHWYPSQTPPPPPPPPRFPNHTQQIPLHQSWAGTNIHKQDYLRGGGEGRCIGMPARGTRQENCFKRLWMKVIQNCHQKCAQWN